MLPYMLHTKLLIQVSLEELVYKGVKWSRVKMSCIPPHSGHEAMVEVSFSPPHHDWSDWLVSSLGALGIPRNPLNTLFANKLKNI